ncbi:hypothetical protein L0337_16370 [candidate division KSB1 bacterium]|nr:hypothetical protein [candidate division KSB1 bacterium]
MIETNIHLIKGGTAFCLNTRLAQIRSQDKSPDIFEKACSILAKRYGLAAVSASVANEHQLLVASSSSVPALQLSGDDWLAEVVDNGNGPRLLFSIPENQSIMAQLVERSSIIAIRRQAKLWNLESNRIWYETTPFAESEDISAFRRYHFSVIPIDNLGLGLVIHISTAFFTNRTVADYFCKNDGTSSQKDWRKRFEFLSQRQKEQKGTLLYNTSKSKHKCYFEEFLYEVTCDTTGSFRIKGESYASLFDYYQKTNAPFTKSDSVARVSFPGISRPVPVAARALRLRVMNDALPISLKQADKIAPTARHQFIHSFFQKTIEPAVQQYKIDFETKFWKPDVKNNYRFPLPALRFAAGKILNPPKGSTIHEYQRYYRQRCTLLSKFGCFHVPISMNRHFKVVLPKSLSETLQKRFAVDLESRISCWIKKSCEVELVPYHDITEAITKLQKEASPGLATIIFDNTEPETYFNLSYELKNWRIKRVLCPTLERKYHALIAAEKNCNSSDDKPPKGVRDWQGFIDLVALDVLQQLGCVPWTFAEDLNYEAQLAIDVGADRRFFALSLLICRCHDRQLPFWIDTIVLPKPDHKNETINEEILRDAIVKLFKRIPSYASTKIRSLLVLRDGRKCGNELVGIRAAQAELARLGCLQLDAKLDIVDFHKNSNKDIRFWELLDSQNANNVIDGSGLFLTSKVVLIANTGAATLRQGTADPIMLVASDDQTNMTVVAQDVVAATQLNFSSPKVAQRLPLTLKRTDDELKARAAQEIRRIK